jgi:hypothetical protein
METSDILLWGGIGLVAYWLLVPATTAAATSATTTSAAGAGASPAAPTASAPAATATPTEAQIQLATLQAMGSDPILIAAQQANDPGLVNGMMTASQWNWYMTKVSGIPGPALATYLSTSAPVTLATYWAALMQVMNQAAIQSEAQQAAGQPATTAGVAGLGRTQPRERGHQPGQGVNTGFAPPGDSENGRYDFQDLGWN